jgi:hypothetical protein
MTHKFAFTVAATAGLVACGTLVGGGVEAAPITAPHAIRTAVDALAMIDDVQFVFGGRRYCWYDDGWQGSGWYWCGYPWRLRLGGGWNGWRGGQREGREFDGRRHSGGEIQGGGHGGEVRIQNGGGRQGHAEVRAQVQGGGGQRGGGIPAGGHKH